MVFSSFGNISTVEPPLFPRAKELAKFVCCKALFYVIILPLLGKRKSFLYRGLHFTEVQHRGFTYPVSRRP